MCLSCLKEREHSLFQQVSGEKRLGVEEGSWIERDRERMPFYWVSLYDSKRTSGRRLSANEETVGERERIREKEGYLGKPNAKSFKCVLLCSLLKYDLIFHLLNSKTRWQGLDVVVIKHERRGKTRKR